MQFSEREILIGGKQPDTTEAPEVTLIARDKRVDVIHLHGGDDVGVVQLLANDIEVSHDAKEFPANLCILNRDFELLRK